MWEDTEFHLLILIVVGHVVVADQIRNPRDRYRRFEDACLCDKPVGQLPAVAYSFNTHAIAIDPKIAPQCRTQPIDYILGFVAVLISKDRIRKRLTVA